MRSSHETIPQPSARLVLTLEEAGINPVMFANYLRRTSSNNLPENMSERDAFEYRLCTEQAKLLILLIDP
jgi:hypothetical protein